VTPLGLAEVDALAARAHAGQVDRIGVPYVEHVRAVAAGLERFGDHLRMAGLLHDVLEDTELTAVDLLAAGVPGTVVETVRRLTRRPGLDYTETIRMVAADRGACLVKIADNAHNSRPDRAAALPPKTRARLARRYAEARAVLWAAVPREDVRAIVSVVNPALLDGYC
jgi:(p)ppGpp synthase/HD superfamily hydrolase